MMHDTCPHCGHRKEPYLMATRSDSSLTEILSGKDGEFMAALAKYGLMAIAVCIIVSVLVTFHV